MTRASDLDPVPGLIFTRVKIKIGGPSLDHDLRRIEAAAMHLSGSDHLAVGALNAYDLNLALTAATAFFAAEAAGQRRALRRASINCPAW